MAIDEALEQSCDTVFYEVARRMWTDELNDGDGAVEQLVEQSKAWGLGAATGIDLPSERTGLVPGREWKRQFWLDNRSSYCSQAKRAPKGSYAHRLFSDLCANGGRWRGGDAVNMSIGQGDLQTTPLQIANAYAAIANGGTLFRPHIGAAVTLADGRVDPVEPEVLAELPVSRRHLRKIAKGLEMVTSQGTAEATFGDFPVPVAGKTGTAEFKPKQPFAWFAAYAPADDPQYVVVTVVEEGGGGSLNAAPITRRILEGLLGLEMNDIQPGVSTD
jgi:penicillin-binding protein 2